MLRGCCCSLCWCSNGAVSFHQVYNYIMKMRKRETLKLSVSAGPTGFSFHHCCLSEYIEKIVTNTSQRCSEFSRLRVLQAGSSRKQSHRSSPYWKM